MTRSNPEAIKRLLERMRDRGDFPATPVIRRFEVYADNDYSGDPAYYITVLLDDGTPDGELTLDRLRPIKEPIFRKLFRNPDEDRWPYIRAIRESEQFLPVEDRPPCMRNGCSNRPTCSSRSTRTGRGRRTCGGRSRRRTTPCSIS